VNSPEFPGKARFLPGQNAPRRGISGHLTPHPRLHYPPAQLPTSGDPPVRAFSELWPLALATRTSSRTGHAHRPLALATHTSPRTGHSHRSALSGRWALRGTHPLRARAILAAALRGARRAFESAAELRAEWMRPPQPTLLAPFALRIRRYQIRRSRRQSEQSERVQ